MSDQQERPTTAQRDGGDPHIVEIIVSADESEARLAGELLGFYAKNSNGMAKIPAPVRGRFDVL